MSGGCSTQHASQGKHANELTVKAFTNKMTNCTGHGVKTHIKAGEMQIRVTFVAPLYTTSGVYVCALVLHHWCYIKASVAGEGLSLSGLDHTSVLTIATRSTQSV